MFCKNCGNEIPDGVMFCTFCGTKQADDKKSPYASAQDVNENAPGNVEAATPEIFSAPLPPAGKKPLNKKIIAAIAAAAAVNVIVLVLVLMPHHEWTDATCTKPKICIDCGKTRGKPLGHKMDIDATCTEPQKCSRCGYTEGKALGHDYGEYKVTLEATCEKDGKKVRVCARCSKEDSMSIDALGHDVEYKVTKEATCTENGIRTGKCSHCGQSFSEDIEKLEHIPDGKTVVIKKATFGFTGKKGQHCKFCGAVCKEETYSLSGKERKQAAKEKCTKTYSFKEISRNPDKFKGEWCYFKGEVCQVCSEFSFCSTYRVNITHNSYWTDAIYVYFYGSLEDCSRIIEDDIITIYGRLDGTYTYETVMGDSLTIPEFIAFYIEVNN